MADLRWFDVHGRFQAEDIDDALGWLAQHFANIAHGFDESYDRQVAIEVRPSDETESYHAEVQRLRGESS